MKVRNLTRKAGEAVLHVWPPSWTSSYGQGSKFAVGEEGVLRGVARRAGYLAMTMEYDGRRHVGVLRWDAPPAMDAVENILLANIGKEIKTIGAIEVAG